MLNLERAAVMSQVPNYCYKSKLTIFCHYWKSIRYKAILGLQYYRVEAGHFFPINL